MDYSKCVKHFFPNHIKVQKHKCLLNQTIPTIHIPKRESLKKSERILVIRSAPRHYTYRNYIRKTWKLEMEPNVPVIFVSGKDNYDLQHESIKYNDILQLDFEDSYQNLTLKMMNIYRYFIETTNVQQIVVINDDTIVNASALKEVFNSEPKNSKMYIMGKVSRGYPRLIFSWLPWYVSANLYPHKCYPPFVQGSSFVISREAATEILDKICDLPTFHLDDVLMGIISNCLNIQMLHREGNKNNFFS